MLDESGNKVDEKIALADVVIQSVGGLSRWDWPDIPGLEKFQGTKIHSAAYEGEAKDSQGKVVAVIGSVSRSNQQYHIYDSDSILIRRALLLFKSSPLFNLLQRGSILLFECVLNFLVFGSSPRSLTLWIKSGTNVDCGSLRFDRTHEASARRKES